MLKSIIISSITSVLILSVGALAQQSSQTAEADSEKSYTNFNASGAVSGTIVLRVEKATGHPSILSSNQIPQNDTEAQALAKTGTFIPVDSSKVVSTPSELTETDKTSGISSWRVGAFGGFRGGYGGPRYAPVYPRYPVYPYPGYPVYGGYVGTPVYPVYYNNSAYFDPCYSYTDNNYDYYYYNSNGWNTAWYPQAYYPSVSVAFSYGYGYGRPYFHPYGFGYGRGYGYGRPWRY